MQMNCNYMKFGVKIGLIITTSLLISNCSNELSINSAGSENQVGVVDPDNSDYPSPILMQSPVLNLGSKIMLFTLNQDKKVYLKTQNSPGTDKTTWSRGYTDLGSPSGKTLANELGAGLNLADGKVYVFGLVTASSTNRRIYYRKESSSGTFNSWTYLNITAGFGGLEVTNFIDGKLAVFTTNSSGKLCCITIPGSGSPVSQQLGNDVVAKFTVARDRDGRLHVFRTSASSSSVRHIYQTASGSWTTQWEKIGPTLPSGIDPDADIQCCLNQNDYLEVFVNTTDRKVYSCKQISGGWSNSWNTIANDVYKKFEVERRSDGGLDLLYIKEPIYNVYGNFSQIYWHYQAAGSTNWTPSSIDGLFWVDGSTAEVHEPFINTFRMSMFYHPHYNALTLFIMVNYYNFISRKDEIFMSYSYETDPEPSFPNNWNGIYTIGIKP